MPDQAVYQGDEELPNPTWEDAKLAIERLDGSSRTEVLIGDLESNAYLIISGGNEGRYLVVAQEKDTHFFLVDRKKTQRLVVINAGGLQDFHPETRVQTLGTAILAAKTYYATRRREARFEWEKGA
jgi:hypothetical protein